MAILEKEVWVTINSANIKFYEQKGYDIPKQLNKSGKMIYKQGENILIKIEDLSNGSHAIVTKVCDDCGKHDPNKMFAHILKNRLRSDGKDRCLKCARKQGEATKRLIVPYEKTLEYFAKINNKEYLLKEFSVKNPKRPNEIHSTSNDRYIWVCMKCESEFDAKVNNRTSNECNCPYCSNQRVNHTNCLWTTHPEVAKLLTNSEIGYRITSGSGKKVNFSCPECGEIDEKNIKNVVTNGLKCLKCSDGFSFPEKFMIKTLSQLDINFKTQTYFKWSKNKRYDFYVPSLNCIIETHGNQHYSDETFKHLGGKSLKEEQENDKLKREIALYNGITEYIIINCSKSEFNHIKENILKSKLSKLLNLEKVDWITSYEYACKSLVKPICDLWNSTKMTTGEIGDFFKIDKTTIRRYLKQGSELGLTEYNREELSKRNSKSYGISTRKKVIQLTKDNVFIKQWDSITEAARTLNIHGANITKACKEEISKTGGFKWMYKEDYEKQFVLNN